MSIGRVQWQSHSYTTRSDHIVSGNHVWTIKDYEKFLEITDQHEEVKSDNFKVQIDTKLGSKQEITFSLEAKLKCGQHGRVPCQNKGEYLSCGIFLVSIKEDGQEKLEASVKVRFKLYIMNREGGQSWTEKVLPTYTQRFNARGIGHISGWSICNAFVKSQIVADKERLLPGGSLRIGCSFEIICDFPQESSLRRRHNLNTVLDDKKDALGLCFKDLLDRKELCDTKLLCQGAEFPCHKVVLSARSDVFKAMLSYKNLKEGQTGTVDIADSDPDSVRLMINFMYTDECSELDKHAIGLLPLADKYNLPRLKVKCEQWMADNICVANAADILLMADLHGSSELSTLALNFVASMFSSIKHTSGWMEIRRGHPEITTKLLDIMATPGFKPNRGLLYISTKFLVDVSLLASAALIMVPITKSLAKLL